MARTVDPAQHRAKREHIMGCAAALFSQQGYEATTVAEICRSARISAGNLFHYFPSKRALFAAILSDGGDDTSQQLSAAQTAEDPLIGLLDFVDHLTAPAVEPIVPGLVLEAMLQAQRDPDLAELLGDDADTEQAGIADLLRRAVNDGAVDPDLDVDRVAAWIMALIGAIYLQAATSEDFRPAEQRPLLRRTVERLLRPY